MSAGIAPKPLKRARDGCWTCRKRKKKCDSTSWPCRACVRLGLDCDREVRLVWENDERREGIGRRGPRTNRQKAEERPEVNQEPQPPKVLQEYEATHRARPLRTSDEVAECEGQHLHQRATEDSTLIESSSVVDTAPTHLAHSAPSMPQQTGMTATNSQALLRLARTFLPHLPPYPRPLEGTELVLLGNYIQRFSRSYPTFAEPNNPFLSVLLPLAMHDSIAMDTLLVLSSAQTGHAVSPSEESEFLRLRQRALRGSRKLLVDEKASSSSQNSSTQNMIPRTVENLSEKNVLLLLAIAVMFLLYDKISGETTWQPHLDFIGQLCMSYLQRFPSSTETAEAFHFLYNIFLYNDLIRATSLMTSTSSEFYVNAGSIFMNHILEEDSRYYFPSLIARISRGDLTVTEVDFAAWDGNMYWLPSFSLSPGTSFDRGHFTAEQNILVELYRTAAVIYLKEQQRRTFASSIVPLNNAADLASMASYAVGLVASVPSGSSMNNTLLWPIGIIARQLNLSQTSERAIVLSRLHNLQLGLGMRHFQRVREVLVRDWAMQEAGSDIIPGQGPTMILLG